MRLRYPITVPRISAPPRGAGKPIGRTRV
jgi:hypothetical protein